MGVMTIAEAWPATGRLFTVDDLDRMPDDGRRYELVDGVLMVSPAPSLPHQVVLKELVVQLHGACPPVAQHGAVRPLYQQVAHVSGGQVFRAERPFSVEVVPARLVADLLPD